MNSVLGKYKSLVIAISVFVVLVASVMVLTLFISTQLESDAVGISVAGRQRMLSQRLFKDLLNLRREAESGGDIFALEKQVISTANLFDSSLKAFIRGGTTKGDDGRSITLDKVGPEISEKAFNSLQEAEILWEPFKRLINQMSSEDPQVDWLVTLSKLVDYYQTHNSELSSHLGELSIALQKKSVQASVVAAGQTALLQRLSTEILELKGGVTTGAVLTELLADMKATVTQFDATMTALRDGGAITNAKGATVNLAPVASPQGKAALEAAAQLWTPYHTMLTSLLDKARDPRWLEHLAESVAFGRDNNLSLLIMMDDVAKELERLARQKAESLRYIQAGALVVAFVFFFGILLRFVKRLQESDAIAEKARRDTENILNTVQEGLFLLDDKLTIGSQFSTATKGIFGKDELSGVTFHDLLRDIITERDMQLTDDYVELLFGGRVNENLIADINPLNQVEINIEREGAYQTKYLSFNFNRVRVGGVLSEILVTVNDVSDKIKLQAELEELREKAQDQLNMLTNLLHIEPNTLSRFLDDVASSLANINDIFRESQGGSSDHHKKLDQIFRIIHKVKGDAAALNLESFEYRAHEFEDMLMALREQQSIGGNDFLPLTVKLNEFLMHHTTVSGLVDRFNKMQAPETAAAPAAEPEQSWDALGQLVNRIASEQGKQVDLHAEQFDVNAIPHKYNKTVWDIAVQLVRNSVVHGIETPHERQDSQKGDAGKLDLTFQRHDHGYELTVRDDGCGIDAEKIRAKAIEKGMARAEDLASWNQNQLFALIFEPGFSTASEVTKDAGRGVGMDIIKDIVQETRGQVQLNTTPGQYCEFKILLPE